MKSGIFCAAFAALFCLSSANGKFKIQNNFAVTYLVYSSIREYKAWFHFYLYVVQITPTSEVCYDVYGCFSSSSPWTSLQRPLVALPKPPYEVGTRFILYTRQNLHEEYELLVDKEPVLIFSPFDAKRPTVFLIHGFTDSHKTSYMMAAKNYLLEKVKAQYLLCIQIN